MPGKVFFYVNSLMTPMRTFSAHHNFHGWCSARKVRMQVSLFLQSLLVFTQGLLLPERELLGDADI